MKLTMKHLRKEYESSIVEQNSCNNDLAVRASLLEKKLACLEEENSALTKEKDTNAIVMQRLEMHNTKLLEHLKLLEDEKEEADCFAKKSTLVMEEQLRGYQAQLAQAKQEAQEASEQQEWKDKLKQVGLSAQRQRDMHAEYAHTQMQTHAHTLHCAQDIGKHTTHSLIHTHRHALDM